MSVRETVPAKPLTAVTVMVDVADPGATTAAGEVAVIVKSAVWAVPRPRNASEMRPPANVRVVIRRALIVLVSFRELILIFIFSPFLGT